MGTLTYGTSFTVDFDDRVLSHLQLVIGAKLRRGESFNFTWPNDRIAGSGRTSIWMHPSIPVLYRFSGSRQAVINRNWIDDLMLSANSSAGLQIVVEPSPDPRPAGLDT
jgi:hypothetical protein